MSLRVYKSSFVRLCVEVMSARYLRGRVDYRYIKRFLCKLFIEVVVFQSKYLFALLLAANVLPPRKLDCCNYYVEEASKPTLRAAD
ncbi:hypothetical protein HBH52_006190 [Parastagonospora nodorum]|nr:hypothetical protein HBH52_006190 [Parastagonospora nodorum]